VKTCLKRFGSLGAAFELAARNGTEDCQEDSNLYQNP
jgi:hypothetical protein